MLYTSILIFICVYCVKCDDYIPQQIHLSYGDTIWDIVVTWSTMMETSTTLQYGIGNVTHYATGYSSALVNGKLTRYIHRVTLRDLAADTKYVYQCGSETQWSKIYWFKTAPKNDKWQPQLIVFGDLGHQNGRSIPLLRKEAQKGIYDAVLHVGDMAYNLGEQNGKMGDAFMNDIQPIAAHLPYMTCPGNHEFENNKLSNYVTRFTMPGGTENLKFSFNMGPLHIISITTDYYYERALLPDTQTKWLENDLKESNFPENREKHPWIILMGHKPMYCSIMDPSVDCNRHESAVKKHLEKLLYNAGVDLLIWGHDHSYERLWPVYDHNVYNGSYAEPYTNPPVPVQVISGIAGCREYRDTFNKTVNAWSAFRNLEYGYMHLKAHNRTHLYLEQVSASSGAIIDSFWIIKDRHGPIST